MFCSNCGEEVKNGSRFCSNCGMRIPEPPVIEETQTEPVQTEPVQTEQAEDDYRLVEERPATASVLKTEESKPVPPIMPEMTRPEVVASQTEAQQTSQINMQQSGMTYTQPIPPQGMTQPYVQGMTQQFPQQPYMQQPYMGQQQFQRQPGMTQPYMAQPGYPSAQPIPGAGKKKPNWKLWVPISVVAALLVVAGILFLVLRRGSDTTDTSSKNKSFELGDEVQAGDLTFTVNDIFASNNISDDNNSSYSYNTTDMFVVIDVSVENTGKKATTISEELFQLENSSGDKLMLSYELRDSFPDKLSAGEDQDYVLLYETPEPEEEYSFTVGDTKNNGVVNLELRDIEESTIPAEPTEEALPAVAWPGTWTRTGDSYYDSSVVEITDLGDGSIYFKFSANSGANTGEIEGVATAIGNQAAYEDTNYGYTVSFILNDNILEVVTGGNFYGVMGEGVTIDGSYMLGEPIKVAPTLESLGILEGSSQEQIFKDLVMEDYDLFINSCQTVMMETDLDGYGATVYSGGVRGLYTINECIIMTAPGDQIWAAVIDGETVKYYTNTTDTNVLPLTIENWRNDFSYYEVQYMNYTETLPEETYDPMEESGDTFTSGSDYYFNPDYITAVDDLAFSPREAYYEGGSLYVVMYIYNGRSTAAYNIDEVKITVSNDYETIAEGSFGALQDATIEPYSYITWTFQYLEDAVYSADADLTSIYTDSYCSYSY